jgi:glycerol-3-phosphate dehydrogenase
MKRTFELSFRTRTKNLSVLSEQQFDLLVIGGGITGAGVARDAALRGLSVAVVERRDFACGTSSRSSKLVHGGLRYLQQGDVGLVREAATERYALRKLAPHLARPRQMVVPAATRSGYAKLGVGLWTYDRIAGVSDRERYRMLSKEEALAIEPMLRAEGLYGAGLYYEYVTDDARLVMEVMKSAAGMGVVAVNYASVVGFELTDGRIDRVSIRDELSGDAITARARVVVNGAGPWVDAVRLLSEQGEKPRLHLTKGIHLGIRRERLPLSRIVVMNARDKRGVFAIPRGAVTYLGTTDTSYLKPEDYPQITMEDVTYLLDAANRTFGIEPLTAADIVSAWAGLRPLLHQEGKKPSELSRKDEVMLGANGLVSVAGGKLTTFRRMAERVVDIAVEALKKQQVQLPAPIGKSDEMLLSSGETGDDVDGYAERLRSRWPRVGTDVVDRLVDLYGSNAERMVEAMSADPRLAERLSPNLAVTQAEVQYAVREEMAMTLEDFLERRSRLLLWDPDNGVTVAESAARAMGAILGWDAQRVETEVSSYRAHVDSVKSFLGDEPEAETRQVAHG